MISQSVINTEFHPDLPQEMAKQLFLNKKKCMSLTDLSIFTQNHKRYFQSFNRH